MRHILHRDLIVMCSNDAVNSEINDMNSNFIFIEMKPDDDYYEKGKGSSLIIVFGAARVCLADNKIQKVAQWSISQRTASDLTLGFVILYGKS